MRDSGKIAPRAPFQRISILSCSSSTLLPISCFEIRVQEPAFSSPPPPPAPIPISPGVFGSPDRSQGGGNSHPPFLPIPSSYDLFGRSSCWSWVWGITGRFIVLVNLCTICEFALLHFHMVLRSSGPVGPIRWRICRWAPKGLHRIPVKHKPSQRPSFLN